MQKTLKVYYEFHNGKEFLSTTVEFENMNPETGTFKFTLCSEYMENGRRKKVKYKEERADLHKVYPKFQLVQTEVVNHQVLQHEVQYTVMIDDFKVSNYYDKFLELLEAKTKLFLFRRLKKDAYTKEQIDQIFDKI